MKTLVILSLVLGFGTGFSIGYINQNTVNNVSEMHQNQFKVQEDRGEKEFLKELYHSINNNGRELSQHQEVELLKRVVDRRIEIIGQ